jgi:hypothetical protein
LTLNAQKTKGCNKTTYTKKIIWDIHKDTDYTDYQNNLKSDFSNWDIDSFNDPDTMWDSWKTKVLAAATDGLGTKEFKGKYNSWFNKIGVY